MTPSEIPTRIEEIVQHSMPDSHKVTRIAALVGTFRKDNPKPEPEESKTDE